MASSIIDTMFGSSKTLIKTPNMTNNSKELNINKTKISKEIRVNSNKIVKDVIMSSISPPDIERKNFSKSTLKILEQMTKSVDKSLVSNHVTINQNQQDKKSNKIIHKSDKRPEKKIENNKKEVGNSVNSKVKCIEKDKNKVGIDNAKIEKTEKTVKNFNDDSLLNELKKVKFDDLMDGESIKKYKQLFMENELKKENINKQNTNLGQIKKKDGSEDKNLHKKRNRPEENINSASKTNIKHKKEIVINNQKNKEKSEFSQNLKTTNSENKNQETKKKLEQTENNKIKNNVLPVNPINPIQIKVASKTNNNNLLNKITVSNSQNKNLNTNTHNIKPVIKNQIVKPDTKHKIEENKSKNNSNIMTNDDKKRNENQNFKDKIISYNLKKDPKTTQGLNNQNQHPSRSSDIKELKNNTEGKKFNNELKNTLIQPSLKGNNLTNQHKIPLEKIKIIEKRPLAKKKFDKKFALFEDGEDLDDFICNDDENENENKIAVRRELSKIKQNYQRYHNVSSYIDDDEDIIETNFNQIECEEDKAAKIADEEDEQEELREKLFYTKKKTNNN